MVATSAVHCSADTAASLTEGTKWNFNWRDLSSSGFKNEILSMSINWNKIGFYTYKNNIKKRSRNHCYRGTAITLTYSESVSVALVVQRAKRGRHITLPSVTGLPYHILPHYRINGTTYGKTVTERKICPFHVVGPCHHGMAPPQVADRRTASDKEGSCEKME